LELYSETDFEKHVFKVNEINKLLKSLVETAIPKINVEGEIAEITLHNTGNIYFKIKDEESQLDCIIFKNRVRNEFQELKKGDHVVLSGFLYVFVKGGKYSLNVIDLKKGGLGKIFEEYLKLVDKLSKEGLFDKAYKKKIPYIPNRIGVITSIDGAALRDILNITHKRFNSIDIVIYPAKVQGEDSVKSIIDAIKAANIHNYVDVIILARGGGSYEDLVSFNDEELARTIFASKIPIISGVGHEIDYTIADHVADVRASTPSHASEIVVPNKNEILNNINNLYLRLENKINERINYISKIISSFDETRINRILEKKIEDNYRILDFLYDKLDSLINSKIKEIRNKLTIIYNNLDKLNPLHIIERGFSLTYAGDKLLKSIKEIKKDDNIKTRVKDGFIISRVDSVINIEN